MPDVCPIRPAASQDVGYLSTDSKDFQKSEFPLCGCIPDSQSFEYNTLA